MPTHRRGPLHGRSVRPGHASQRTTLQILQVTVHPSVLGARRRQGKDHSPVEEHGGLSLVSATSRSRTSYTGRTTRKTASTSIESEATGDRPGDTTRTVGRTCRRRPTQPGKAPHGLFGTQAPGLGLVRCGCLCHPPSRVGLRPGQRGSAGMTHLQLATLSFKPDNAHARRVRARGRAGEAGHGCLAKAGIGCEHDCDSESAGMRLSSLRVAVCVSGWFHGLGHWGGNFAGLEAI
ncbi:hypothetical protein C8T65DRAFT_102423 [Cerioporus squamosus]|nr:hypothetical protein C8T65DRAFT_102423 [Cerioporus squamosus]